MHVDTRALVCVSIACAVVAMGRGGYHMVLYNRILPLNSTQSDLSMGGGDEAEEGSGNVGPHIVAADASATNVCWICFENCSPDDTACYCECQTNCYAHEACIVGWSAVRQRCLFCDGEWRLPSNIGSDRGRPSLVADRHRGDLGELSMAIGASIYCYLQLGLLFYISTYMRGNTTGRTLIAMFYLYLSSFVVAAVVHMRRGGT